MGQRIAVLLLALAISGCGWFTGMLRGEDNTPPPAELQPIEQPIAVAEIWETQVGSGTEGAFVRLPPAVEGGRLYAASHDGTVMAVDTASGETLWETDTDLSITAGVGLGEGLVLVGTDEGQVLALSRTDGEELWRARVSSEVLASPRVARGIVVVRSVDGKFTGLDSRTGQRRWISPPYTVPVLTLRGMAPPLLTDEVAIAGLDTGKLLILALDSGAPVSEKIIAAPRGRTELERLVDIDSEPRVAGGMLYVTAYQGNVTALDLRTGGQSWSREISSHSGLEVDAERLYLTDETGTVWALDRRTGATLWQQTALTGRAPTRPVAGNERVVVGDFEGYLHWLDQDTGRIVGRVRADDEGISEAPAVLGDTLYVFSEDGTLSAFRAES